MTLPETETFEDVERLLYYLVNRTPCRCGLCSDDERRSIARMEFVVAYRRYDPGRGVAFSTMVGVYIRNALLRECKRNRHFQKHRNLPENTQTSPPKTCCLWEVSKDAQDVFHLLMDLPQDMSKLFWRSQKRERFVVKHLLKMGWPLGTIVKALDELREFYHDTQDKASR